MAPKRPRPVATSSSSSSSSDGARSSSSPPARPAQSSTLLNLPVELVEIIYSHIKTKSSRRHFAETCSALWVRWGAEWVVHEWSDDWLERWEYFSIDKVQLFCFEDAVKGEDGYTPFFISGAQLFETELAVGVIAPHAKWLTRSEDDVYLDAVRFAEEVFDTLDDLTDHGKYFVFDFNEKRSKMCVADTDLIRERSPCPVCNEAREVRAGSAKLCEW